MRRPERDVKVQLIESPDDLAEGIWYFEFAPGPFRGEFWRADSVYLHGNVVDLVVPVFVSSVVGFDPYGPPTTISGAIITRLAENLESFAQRIAQAEAPRDLWAGSILEEPPLTGPQDWSDTQRDLCIALRDLSRWLLRTKARGEPVTILGL